MLQKDLQNDFDSDSDQTCFPKSCRLWGSGRSATGRTGWAHAPCCGVVCSEDDLALGMLSQGWHWDVQDPWQLVGRQNTGRVSKEQYKTHHDAIVSEVCSRFLSKSVFLCQQVSSMHQRKQYTYMVIHNDIEICGNKETNPVDFKSRRP